ncbi:MAG TPA: nucleotidyltransferase domain-containing protein [Patescibacteria group bacterium]|nr:nucleotidyltransferase domain-containing protein [Patescibacteria group bacterium]
MFEQDRVIVRLQQRVLREKSIVACYLAGSFGRGKADSYSDLDVVLVFTDQASRDQAYEERREFIQSVLPYVPAKSFDANHIMPNFHIALYSNGAKVDYQFEIMSNLDYFAGDENIRLLKDEIGWADHAQSIQTVPQKVIEKPLVSSIMLTDLDNRFWVMYMDVYRLLLRGDFDKSYPIYLELLHFTVPQMIGLLPVSSQARKNLIHAFFSQDAQNTLKHLRELLPAYQTARSEIINLHDLSFIKNINFEREITTLIQKT